MLSRHAFDRHRNAASTEGTEFCQDRGSICTSRLEIFVIQTSCLKNKPMRFFSRLLARSVRHPRARRRAQSGRACRSQLRPNKIRDKAFPRMAAEYAAGKRAPWGSQATGQAKICNEVLAFYCT